MEAVHSKVAYQDLKNNNLRHQDQGIMIKKFLSIIILNKKTQMII